jgi:hypothetical protein
MTSGNSFTYNEDVFILQHPGMFPSDIAKELSAKFHDENRGHRSYWGVRDRMKLLKERGITVESLRDFRLSEEQGWQTARQKHPVGRPKKKVAFS